MLLQHNQAKAAFIKLHLEQRVQTLKTTVRPKAEEDDKNFGLSISEDHIRALSTLTLKDGLGEKGLSKGRTV